MQIILYFYAKITHKIHFSIFLNFRLREKKLSSINYTSSYQVEKSYISLAYSSFGYVEKQINDLWAHSITNHVQITRILILF